VPGNPQTEAQFDSTIGALYSSLEMHADAERWYRKVMKNSPDGYQRLASTLGRQGRYREAIELCEKAAEKDSSVVPSLVLASVLLEGQPAENDYERAEALLKKAKEAYPNQTDLLGALGALQIQRSNLDEATALFRRVLELRPRDELAMNNLATVLIERPDTLPEGKEIIERAIERFGPQPGLLDVKGVCLIAEGKPKDAASLYEDACSSPRADPRYCFHWAVACQRAGDMERAKIILKRALELNLYGQILTPSDRKMLAELESEFTDHGR
jgi:Flp pilus assembly protein TadD